MSCYGSLLARMVGVSLVGVDVMSPLRQLPLAGILRAPVRCSPVEAHEHSRTTPRLSEGGTLAYHIPMGRTYGEYIQWRHQITANGYAKRKKMLVDVQCLASL